VIYLHYAEQQLLKPAKICHLSSSLRVDRPAWTISVNFRKRNGAAGEPALEALSVVLLLGGLRCFQIDTAAAFEEPRTLQGSEQESVSEGSPDASWADAAAAAWRGPSD